ncbi:hypothetical protein F5Y01DRAFT_316402 [Xylaria sp. FL0043]|nr:hypothetical protein F5Y01DRAFT_316402 [Xylaria sp. FL0043]
MASSKRQFPPSEWLQRKATIRNMYLIEKRSLNDIVRALACEDFHPNKHQLEYQIKLWGFNKKNIPKSLADATWRYIGYEIANRKARGENAEVVLFGQIQDKKKVEIETRRYFRFRYGGEPIPMPPDGVDILLRIPSGQQPIPWPLCLPWLQFQSRYVTGLPLRAAKYNLQQDSAVVQNSVLTVVSTIIIGHPLTSPFESLTESSLVSLLKTTMPESYPDEAPRRAKVIARGWSKQASEELVMILLYYLSNKARISRAKWDIIYEIIERSGVMSAAIKINDSVTLLAVRESLFQLSFEAILDPSPHGIGYIGATRPKILKLVKWLLRSGQHPDTGIDFLGVYGIPNHVAPLQIAARSCSKDLLVALLEKGANPDLVPRFPQPLMNPNRFDPTIWSMPPIFVAAHSARQADDLGCIDLLLSSGATIYYNRSSSYGFLSRVTFLSLLAGKKEEGIALDIIKLLATRPMGVAYLEAAKSSDSADTAISAASRGNLEIIKLLHYNGFDVTKANEFGLTALHAAADGGHVKCCEFLLNCGIDKINRRDFVCPSPVHLACFQNHIEVVKLLHGQGASIDEQPPVPQSSWDLLFERYFCYGKWHILTEEAAFARQIQSPIEAVLGEGRIFNHDILPPFESREWSSRGPLVSYLLRYGSTIPLLAASRAASHRDKELLSVALAAGADPNYPGSNSKTPLSLALGFEKFYSFEASMPEVEDAIQIAKMLLTAGAEATKSDAVRAIRFNDCDLVKEMLGRTLLAPSASSGCADETTLLEAALLSGNSCIIKEVLKYDSTRYSPGALCAATFQAATGEVDPNIVHQLLRYRNPDSTSRESLTLETTAVGIAACYETPTILELLLSHIPVFHSSYFPSRYLDRISVRETLETVLVKGTKPFWHSDRDEICSVLIYALESTPNVMTKLLDQGYKFDWKAVTNAACLNREEQYLDLIADQPILWYDEDDTDEYDANGALHFAIHSGNNNLVQSLLKIYQTVGSGKLGLGCRDGLLQVAIEVGNSEIFDTIIEAGISPHAPASDSWGMTALQAAAIHNRVGLAKRLIDLKVDINAPGSRKSGRTALEGAAEYGHIDLIKLLLDSGVETNGSGQFQYLRAIGLASFNCHHVAADMLKSHRKLTAEDLLILEGKSLLEGCYGWLDSESEDGRESVGEDEVEDDDDSAHPVDGTLDGDTTVIHTEDAGLSQEGNCQSLQIDRDETLLSHDDETNGHNPEVSEDYQLRRELSPVLDITAPSEGIYDFDYPLFGICDMEDPSYENP